ncbi:FKBP-type peptidyl-prolyl cis-trans isomerase [Brevundimonas subvibrioides]|uniref:Peptidyl-prolyl cis-trans isomerase n=1 Tax=Brevundimonas subvibrioides (strain ATCC 15264 / DSM 4735 / LMG 14903 / NBRC 16000 / CB 81) TaxID=633149 RepID=D9QN59_BRESC|nr:FKBP-type peptidyl-prolyl cis-trans isomerase [Brevundimonas subvibrioides]ADL00260.1 peptidylprolyl isomerase FKBP-type [Brevundimonas subvibrioides ATCC 15264]
MRFGWVRPLALVAVLAVSACNRGDVAPGADLEANAEAAEFFLTSNARAEGVRTTASGLQYKVLTSGPSGAVSPDRNDLVRVDYEGALTDGTVFDSSFAKGIPFATHVDEVVPGWTEALQLMKAGDEWMLYLPPALGYGERGQGDIPPNAVLVFRVKLLDVAPVPGGGRGVGLATG